MAFPLTKSSLRPMVLRPIVLATAAAFGAAVLAAPLREAHADDVSPTGKGIAGGALLGAEVVTIGESLVGVRPGWAYAVGAIVGAGGGGAAGYVVEKGSTDGKVPVYMLAGGLALVIPAVVLTLNATRYMPEEGASEDRAPTGPAAEPGTPGGSVIVPPSGAPGTSAPPVTPPATPPPPAPPPPPPQALLDVNGAALRAGVPVPEVTPVFSVAEQKAYGIGRDPVQVRMAVLHVVF